MAALIQQTLEFSNQIQDLAKGFDISVAKVLQFQDAIKTSGGNAEGASKMLSSLFTKIQDAQGGNEAAIAQFEKLGISFKELIALKPEQAINRIFEALNSESLSTYERVKMVKEMLGKQGIGLAIDEVAGKLNMSVESYRKHEAAIKRLGDVSDNLKTSMDNLKIAFADVISPLARDGLVSVEKFKAALYAIGSVYLLSQLMKLYEVLMLVRKALAANAALSAGLAAMGGKKGLALLATAFATYKGAEAIFGANEDEPKGPSASGRLEGKEDAQAEIERQKAMEANRREIKAAEAKVALAKELTDLEHQQSNLKFDALKGDKFRADLGAIELQRKQSIATLENARAQALNKENLSEDQIRLINADYNQQRDKANQKAKDDRRFLYEQEHLANELLIKQLENTKALNALEREAADLRFKSIGMDKNAVELAGLELQYKTEIARINAQEAMQLLKTNQTAGERAAITAQANIDRANAEQKLNDAKKIANALYQTEVDAVSRVRNAQWEIYGLDIKSQQLAQSKYKMRESDVRLVEEQLNLERTVADLRRQQKEAQIRLGQGELYEQEKRRIDELISSERALSAARQQQIMDEEARRKSFSEGFNQAARQFALDAENYSKLGADVFSSAIGNMNSAIDTFVRTGKFAFKDFAKSVIQDIIAMILKFQAMQLVMMGMRAMGFGGFMTPVQGGFGGGATYAAAGGEIDQPTIVGENGPELFIPSRRGTVIPNLQATSMMGNQPQAVYNGPYIANMQAIDTQSAVQFLAKNKMAVWSANQSAGRSVPTSR
jgi:lambda family phage tail tape measure protein